MGSVRVYAMAAAAAPAAKPVVQVVQEAHGFKLQRQQFVKEYDSTVLLYKHGKTGEATDPNLPTSQSVSHTHCGIHTMTHDS